MDSWMIYILPLLIGWLLDLILGDPSWLPHPIVGFGKMIDFGEHRLNKDSHRKLKGALMTIFLIVFIFVVVWLIRTAIFSLSSPFHLPCYALPMPFLG